MRTLTPIGVLLAGTLAATIGLAACSSSSATPTAAPASEAATTAPVATAAASDSGGAATGNAVTIQGFAFAPSNLTVKAGTTVTWTNQDSVGHTVTFDSDGKGSDRLGNGATFSQAFATAGTFTYHCSIHSSMTGTITVTQ